MQKTFYRFLALTLAFMVVIGTFNLSPSFAASGGADDVNLLAHQNWDFKRYNDFNQFPKDSGLVKDSDYTTGDDMELKTVSNAGYQSSNAIQTTINSNGNQSYFILPKANEGFQLNFVGAKEFWVWVDLSGLKTGFRKAFFGFQSTDGKIYQTDDMDGISNMSFYIQDSNGNWQEKHFDTDGCMEGLGNYKGFIRFSTDYFVSGSEKIDLSKLSAFEMWYDLDGDGPEGVGSTFVIDHVGFAGPSMTGADGKVSDLASNGTLVLPSSLPAQTFDESNVVLRYGAISDLHVSDEAGTAAQKVQSALGQLKQKAGNNLDAVLAVGDLTDYGKNEQAQALQKVISGSLDLSKTRFLLALGNHDYYNHVAGNAPDMGGNLFKQYFGNTVYQDATDQEVQAGDYHTTVNNYDFIIVNCAQYEGGIKYSQSDLDWLSAELAKAQTAHPNQPIFVASHPTITDTTYAGNHAGDYYNSTYLYPILKNYPQAIYFSGHTHYNLNDEKDIWQGDFTTVGTAAVYYGCVDTYTNDNQKYYGVTGDDPADYMQFSQGLYVEVDKDNNVKLTRMDFYHQKEIKKSWIIPAPKPDKSQLLYYSNARELDHAAPSFANGSTVQVDSKDIDKNKITVSFDKAQDDDMISSYRIQFIDKATDKILKTIPAYSDFYQYPQPADMPSKLAFTFSVGTLAPFTADYEKDFYVRVTAVDSWDAASDPIDSVTYPGTAADPNKPVEKAGPDFHGSWNFKLFNDFNTYKEGYTFQPNVDYNSWPVPADVAKPQPFTNNGFLSTPALTTRITNMENPFFVYFPTEGHSYKTDFSNAKEFWIWVDFSDVQFRKIDFGVRKNDGYGDEYKTDDFDNQTDMKAYIQDGNGGWKSVDFDTDGCLPEFGHYKGFIRFPMDYMHKGDDTLYPDNIGAFYLWFSPSSSNYVGKDFTFDEVGFAGPNMADADGTLTDLMNGNIPAKPTNPANPTSPANGNFDHQTHNGSTETQKSTPTNSTLQISTNTSGGILATVATQPDHSPVVTNGRSALTVTVPADAADVVVSATAQKSAQIKVSVPTSSILEQLNSSAVNSVDLTITVPSALANNTNANAHVSINLEPAVFQAAKETKKDVIFNISDAQTGAVTCSWTFSGTNLKNSAAPVSGVDLAVSVQGISSDTAVSAVAANNSAEKQAAGLVLKFGDNGLLPTPASVRIYVGNQAGCTPNSRMYLYYYNSMTKALEQMPKNESVVDANGYVTITIVHGSEYVLLPKAATNVYPVKSDTTYTVGVKSGKAYTFAITVSGNAVPVFTVGNGKLFTGTVKRQGNRYYYTVKAIGKTDAMTAVYSTLPKQRPVALCYIASVKQ